MKRNSNLIWTVMGILSVFISSCSTGPTPLVTDQTEAPRDFTIATATPTQNIIPFQKEIRSRSASDIENLTIDEVIRIEDPNTQNLYDNSRYDFPITMNSRVEGWIDYFTGRGRGHMERYLSRSSRYIPMMKQIFKKAGLPEDLVYLALIESGFNLRAKSRAKATGPWQFMKATGKRYGLRVDAWVDERRDPIRSTEAAANYLKDLYLMFESWYLAASAYNAGEYKVLRAIEQSKTNNYWRICETKMLHRETKDYVPKLIAAAIIAKNSNKYGFSEVDYQEPLQFERFTLAAPAKLKSIAKMINISEDDILDLNPSFARSITPPSGGPYEIRIPPGTKVLLERSLASSKSTIELGDMPSQLSVKSGDTLSSIAQKYKIRVKDLANLNNLGNKEALIPGSILILPKETESRSSKKPIQLAKRETSSSPSQRTDSNSTQFILHRVQKGDSLWSIAEQYNVTVQSLFKWNHLKRSQIMPGKEIKIRPGSTDRSNSGTSKKATAKKS
ncbi:MAG: LysM peptidoglycan-binding domain-containing protein [Proteobacteria bacterium]|nr:LysM peptidoglycan-binding domain-containing protein [Pseudomonadota bacterium]